MKNKRQKVFPCLRISGRTGYINAFAKNRFQIKKGDEILLKKDEYNFHIAINSIFNNIRGSTVSETRKQLHVGLSKAIREIEIPQGLWRITSDCAFDKRDGIEWFVLQFISN